MKEDNDILQRAKDFDLTESELAKLYSDSNQLEAIYDEALVQNLSEDLFIPGNKELLNQKKKEIEGLTKGLSTKKQKPAIFSMKILGVAASILLLAAAIFLLKPQSSELSEKQIAEFKEISKSTYSPEVIASLERSSENIENRELVTAYIEKDYDKILSQTSGVLDNAELKLLRARVLMDLERYKEGFDLMKSIDQEELIQKDVYLWMMAEGALGVGDERKFNELLNIITKSELPGNKKIQTIY